MKICDFTKPELDKFREQCNFTEDERQCFDLKAKGMTNIQLSVQFSMSESKVSMTMKRVRTKITKIVDWEV